MFTVQKFDLKIRYMIISQNNLCMIQGIKKPLQTETYWLVVVLTVGIITALAKKVKAETAFCFCQSMFITINRSCAVNVTNGEPIRMVSFFLRMGRFFSKFKIVETILHFQDNKTCP